MTDRVDRLREAAQARHEATLRRATNAVQRMARCGDAVTFRRVAETAGVSRSWLYRQPQLRDEINRLRDTSTGRPGTLPSTERATTDSLRQQLRTYRDEITRLRTENQELRDQLARHLGAARAAAVTRGPMQS
jgi:HAMP domain-containing protein